LTPAKRARIGAGMNLPRIEIVEGEVVKVQLTSETHVAGRARVQPGSDLLVSSRVINHMRLFIAIDEKTERDFSFTNTTVGIREGHRVAIVRAKPAGPGPWLNIALYNLTTQQREEQIGAFAKAARQQWVQARYRAALWGAGVFVLDLLIGPYLHPRDHSLKVAVAMGVLAVPVAWLIGALTDAIVLPARQRAAEKALRAAIDERMGQHKDDPAPSMKKDHLSLP
jgi:hypothetical protein